MTTPVKKQYKSLGQMLKAGDFSTLLEELQTLKDSGKLKEFASKPSPMSLSEFDDLLFFLPQYAVKRIEDENGEEKLTNELQPKVKEVSEFCLANGANPMTRMKNGENTYLKACEIPNVEILDYLINNPYKKIDLTHTDGMNNSGLYYATMAESVEVIEYLVQTCNFNVNEKNFLTNNMTCLHYACGHAKEKSIDKLLEMGANPTIKEGNGYEPFEMMLPAYDEETIEEYEDDPEELEKWARLYVKMTTITEDYRSKHKPSLKTKF